MSRGLDPARVHAWANGATPSLPQLRMLADALGVTLGVVLAASGLAREDELTVTKTVAAPLDIDEAIEHAPGLADFEREFLRNAREIARQARPTDNDPPAARKRQRRTTTARSQSPDK